MGRTFPRQIRDELPGSAWHQVQTSRNLEFFLSKLPTASAHSLDVGCAAGPLGTVSITIKPTRNLLLGGTSRAMLPFCSV